MQRSYHHWVPLVTVAIELLLVHLGVLGNIAWNGNSTGARAGALVVTLITLVGVYVATFFYARWVVFAKVRGVWLVVVFACIYVSVVWVHAALFYCMALYGEAFTGLPAVTDAFKAYYAGTWSMTVGVFNTAGNVSTIPLGVVSHLWWGWTSISGWIFWGFLLGFALSRLMARWTPSYADDTPLLTVPIEWPIAARRNEHPYSTRRRSRAPPRNGLPVQNIGGIRRK